MRAIILPLALVVLATGIVGERATARADRARTDPVATGRQLYEQHCVSCHGAGVGYPPFPNLPGTGALEVKYKGEQPAVLTQRTDLTPEIVAYFVRNGVSAMAPYRKTELSDAEVAQLGAYLSSKNPDLRKTRK